MDKKDNIFSIHLLKPKSYTDLLRVFVLFFTIVAITILLLAGFGIRNIYKNHIIRDAELSTADITEAILRQSKELLFTQDPQGNTVVHVEQNNLAELDKFMRGYLKSFGIVKIKIYSKEKRIIYSSEESIIGQVDTNNQKLQEALEGKISSKYEREDIVKDLTNEERFKVDVVETYIPISDKDNDVIGSFEIYSDITKYRKEISYVFLSSILLLGLLLSVSFVFLFTVLKRVTKIIAYFAEEEKNYAAAVAAAEMERQKAEELRKAYCDLKETQDMLLQAGKMSAIGEFSSGIAHDLNNPLAVISGALEFLKKNPTLNSDVNETLNVIITQTERIRLMVNSLLSFSRKKKAQFTDINLNQLLSSIKALLAFYPEFERITWSEKFEDNLPSIYGDFSSLQEVFVNLGINACQAMPNGGKIDFSAKYNHDKKCIDIIIRDTGRGMDEEQLKKIFIPFFSTKETGTGLGLSICRRIIEEHNGKIEVQSIKGVGTTFIITLPTGNKELFSRPDY